MTKTARVSLESRPTGGSYFAWDRATGPWNFSLLEATWNASRLANLAQSRDDRVLEGCQIVDFETYVHPVTVVRQILTTPRRGEIPLPTWDE
jgi:hypothetical protein